MPTGVKGMLIECTRCGKTHFLERLEDGVTDGGYTKYEKYQPEPKDWLWSSEFGYLCTECAVEFKTLITSFFNGSTRLIKAWRDDDWVFKQILEGGLIFMATMTVGELFEKLDTLSLYANELRIREGEELNDSLLDEIADLLDEYHDLLRQTKVTI